MWIGHNCTIALHVIWTYFHYIAICHVYVAYLWAIPSCSRMLIKQYQQHNEVKNENNFFM